MMKGILELDADSKKWKYTDDVKVLRKQPEIGTFLKLSFHTQNEKKAAFSIKSS